MVQISLGLSGSTSYNVADLEIFCYNFKLYLQKFCFLSPLNCNILLRNTQCINLWTSEKDFWWHQLQGVFLCVHGRFSVKHLYIQLEFTMQTKLIVSALVAALALTACSKAEEAAAPAADAAKEAAAATADAAKAGVEATADAAKAGVEATADAAKAATDAAAADAAKADAAKEGEAAAADAAKADAAAADAAKADAAATDAAATADAAAKEGEAAADATKTEEKK